MTRRSPHGIHYRRLTDIDQTSCVYCGEPAEHIDHVLPVSFITQNRAPLTKTQRAQLITVPACADCNHRAGGRVFKSLMQKRNWLRVDLENKERRLLLEPMWTEQEIAALGHGIRGYVIARQAKRVLTLTRLTHDGLPEDWHDYRNIDAERVSWKQDEPRGTWPPASSRAA